MNRLQQEYLSHGLAILAISNEDRGRIDAFVQSEGVAYPVYRDPSGAAASAFGVRGIPHAFLIDAQDQILFSGHPDSEGLHDLIESHLR